MFCSAFILSFYFLAFFSCHSDLLSRVIFLLEVCSLKVLGDKTLLVISPLSFYLSEYVFIFLLLSLGWWLFYVNTSKIFSWTFAFISFEICFQHNCHPLLDVLPFSLLIKFLFLCFMIPQFDYNISRCDFFLFSLVFILLNVFI